MTRLLLALALLAGSAASARAQAVNPLLVKQIDPSDQVSGMTMAAIASAANGALQRAAAGPLATQPGANAQAAAWAAIGYTPYDASNPAGYQTASQINALALVQTVGGHSGNVTAAQLAAALSGQDLSGALFGGGKTGASVAAAEGTDQNNIASLQNQVNALQSTNAPVQSVAGHTGTITAAQIASGLSGQDISSSVLGNGKTGQGVTTAQVNDESSISSLSGQITPIPGQLSTIRATQTTDEASLTTVKQQIAGFSLYNDNMQNGLDDRYGAQNIETQPIGNSPYTLSSLNLSGNAKSSSEREFLANLGFTSNTGIKNNGNADKVTLYAGMQCLAGSGQCWAANFLFNAASGMTASGTGLEADANNSGADAPLYTSRALVALGANGTISGSNNFMSAGVLVASVQSRNIFHDGFAVVNNSAHDAAYADFGNSAISYYNQGPHATAMVNDTGTSPVSYDAGGTYSISALFTQYAHTNYSLVAGPGQKVCLNGTGSACIYYKASNNQIIITDDQGTAVMAIARGGNVAIRGSLSQNVNVTP